jgi:hypothetical protein
MTKQTYTAGPLTMYAGGITTGKSKLNPFPCGCVMGRIEGASTFAMCPTHKAAPELAEQLKLALDALEAHGIKHLAGRAALAKAGVSL